MATSLHSCVYGHVEHRLGAGLEPDRLVVEHPVGDIVVAFLDQKVGRFPGFGQPRTKPAARRLAGRFQNKLPRLADVGALVLHFLHIALGESVADEFPLSFDRRAHDRRISGKRRAVDGEHGGDRKFVKHLDEPPKADTVAVFVPGPVGDVGHRRAAGRRREHRARHRLGRVPLFDIDDDPHRHTGAARQFERRTLVDSRIGDAIGRQHALLRPSSLSRGFSRPRGHRGPTPAGRGKARQCSSAISSHARRLPSADGSGA